MNPEANHPPLSHPAAPSASEFPAVPSATDPPARDFRLWLVPLLVLLAVQLGAPFVPVPNRAVALLGVIFLTLIYVGGVVAFSLALARRQMTLAILLGGCLVFTLIYKSLQLVPPKFSFGYVTQNFALLGLGTFFGLLVARMIRHANMIGPIGVMVAVIDIWGVLFGGIVSQLLTNKATQKLAQKAMAGGPKLGAASAKFHLALPDIGIGDILFLALFLGVLVRFGMNWRASVKWMWALISLALFSIVLGVPALPGLLFIAAGAVLPNLRYFRFTREERFALLYAGLFVVILTIGLYFGFTAMLPKHA